MRQPKQHWYKNALVYEVDVESYYDANGDGVGDFEGFTRRLDYLANLGVTLIWLLPFFPTPNKDNGYDVTDYYSVDPRLGNLGDFVALLKGARERNLRVLIDLPLNHTSDQHPWFQAARKDRTSKYRDYYVWLDKPPEGGEEKKIFGDRQDSLWTYDEAAGQYFYHTFYKFQPDLNLTNPAVRAEIRKIMSFWLELGISGFRIDAVPHMLRDKGDEHFEGDPLTVLEDMRAFVEEQRRDTILIGEVDAEPEQYRNFFGDGDRLHMLFNFYLDNYLFLAFARDKAEPIRHALNALPEIHESSQWANFLRNHDELDLERLSEEEREFVYSEFAPQENMREFGRGIRRRLAPILGGDQRRLELAFSLLLTLPGTPVIYYGDELGMGEDLSLDERWSVRTAMHWTPLRNGGFSSAPKEKLSCPVISEGPYSYKCVNVRDQQRDEDSLLTWLGRAVRLRKESPEFGLGRHELVEVDHEAVLAHLCRYQGELALAVHNLADVEVTVTPQLAGDDKDDLLDVFGDRNYPAYDKTSGQILLAPYGYRWFRKGTPHL